MTPEEEKQLREEIAQEIEDCEISETSKYEYQLAFPVIRRAMAKIVRKQYDGNRNDLPDQ